MNDVYIDVLILENTVMNYVILHITSIAVSSRVKWYRLLSGALIGTLYAVISLWLSVFLHALIAKILLSAVMVTVTFFPRNIKTFARISACFYGVTFLFAGISFALLIAGPVKYTGNILATVCVGYIIVMSLAGYVKRRHMASDVSADVFIQFDKEYGEGVWLPAIIDSGNLLRDPFSGDPVIVAELDALEKELPCELYEILRNKNTDILDDASAVSDAKGWENRFRLIPYNALGNENGILPGFKADIVRVNNGKRDSAELRGVIVCLYEKALSEDKQYRALLAPDMIA